MLDTQILIIHKIILRIDFNITSSRFTTSLQISLKIMVTKNFISPNYSFSMFIINDTKIVAGLTMCI